MYINDLNESIEGLPKSAIVNIFQKQKHITISQRIALFHKLRLRDYSQTQEETAASMGIQGSRSFVAQYDGLCSKLSGHSFWSSILDALSEDRLWEERGKRRKKLDISGLYKKFNAGAQPECVLRCNDGWHIRWKELP